MALLVMQISVELDAMHDAIDTLQEVHARLATRHGEAFRRLDRAIEDLIEADDLITLHSLGSGKMVAAPAGQFTAVLREARRLGMIA